MREPLVKTAEVPLKSRVKGYRFYVYNLEDKRLSFIETELLRGAQVTTNPEKLRSKPLGFV